MYLFIGGNKGNALGVVLLLCYNVGKQVNTDNKHKSFTVLVRLFVWIQ